MNKLNNKLAVFILIGVLCVFLIIKYAIIDNVNLLINIVQVLEKPSKSYYLLMERIYLLSKKDNLSERIIKHLEDNTNKRLHITYIQVLGIIGKEDAAACLMDEYIKCQDNPNNSHKIYHIIDSLGLIGNEEIVPILKRLLENYDKHNMQVPRYSIARALFLLTGNRYEYINDEGEKTKIFLTDELKNARKIIYSSKARMRTIDEMKQLDRLFRPPDPKWQK